MAEVGRVQTLCVVTWPSGFSFSGEGISRNR